VRLLWLLPKAAPALLRHLVAYVDLAGLELAKLSEKFLRNSLQPPSSPSAPLCCFYGCLAVVAYTWDTPYRVNGHRLHGGCVLAAALQRAVYRYNVVGRGRNFLPPCGGNGIKTA